MCQKEELEVFVLTLIIALRKGKRQCTYPISSCVCYDKLSPFCPRPATRIVIITRVNYFYFYQRRESPWSTLSCPSASALVSDPIDIYGCGMVSYREIANSR
uniref:Uncharacterized protein n=1 Tax=Utricularia reniformis TaxID=192314 RepID=A0A1Y0AYY3_9LAMI|nr:hypothetical protein AEK19_MT1251 [Utricularia reniformis]ART30361.1 hypothetical protein AEK19_MT1251 [Utricularia reniformis]